MFKDFITSVFILLLCYKFKDVKAQNCGKALISTQEKETDIIVHGTFVNPQNKYPWMVLVYNANKIKHCTSSLISAQFILTAAHCFLSAPVLQVLDSYKLSCTLATGVTSSCFDPPEYFLVALAPPSGQKPSFLPIHSFYPHPQFNPVNLDYDIAVIRLPQPLPLNVSEPICLPPINMQIPRGTRVKIAGWGRTEPYGPKYTTDFLLEGGSMTLSKGECTVSRNYKYTIICIQGNRQGVCQGDSGGPLMVQLGNVHYAFGLVSWGAEMCFPYKPQYFTDVRPFLPWIYSIMGRAI